MSACQVPFANPRATRSNNAAPYTPSIEVPESVIARAATLGVPVETLVTQALEEITREPILPGFVPLGKPTHTPAEAGELIRLIASRHSLGGLSIKNLINEGRRIKVAFILDASAALPWCFRDEATPNRLPAQSCDCERTDRCSGTLAA